jgi:hypothetical protein
VSKIRVHIEGEDRRKADAEAQTAAAAAVTAWRTLGVEVDAERAADAAGVTRRMTAP